MGGSPRGTVHITFWGEGDMRGLLWLLFGVACSVPVDHVPRQEMSALEGKCTVEDQGRYSAEAERREAEERRLGTSRLVALQAKTSMNPPDTAFVATDQVAEITSWNFKDVVHPLNQHTVLNVFAPWCPVSQVFDPLYHTLANLTAERADVKFVMLNGDNDIELRHRFKVLSYPTLLMIKKGTNINKQDLSKDVTTFDGKRLMDDMVAWVREAGPTVFDIQEKKKAKATKAKAAKKMKLKAMQMAGAN